MRPFAFLICMLVGHQPARNRVRKYYGRYYGRCNRCGARVQRIRHNKWRLVFDVPPGAP